MVVHDRSSTAGALLGVVAIVFLVGQQLSVLFGLLNYMSVLVDHSNADTWITSADLRNADAGNLISTRYLDRAMGFPQVEWAAPILVGNGLFRTPDGSFEAVRVVGCRRPRLAGGPWDFAEADETALLDFESVTVDRLDFEKLGRPMIGTVTEIGGRRVRVGAITDGARGFQGTLVFAPLDKVKQIAATPPGRYSAILLRFRPGTDHDDAVARLRAAMPECSVFTTAELSRLTRLYYFTNTGIGGSFGFSTAIAVMIGIVIISLTMYVSVLGRYRDFAVLRALGGRRRDVAAVVFSQALMIAGAGVFIGFVLLAALLDATRGSAIPSYMPPLRSTAAGWQCRCGQSSRIARGAAPGPESRACFRFSLMHVERGMHRLVLEQIARDFTDGRQVRRVLFPTDLEIAAGELTVLAGPSGSGKTTLLSIIGLVLRPSEGRLILGDRDVSRLDEGAAADIRLREYGFVFQQPMLIEGLSVLENVLLSVAVQGRRPSKAMRTRAMDLLASLGLAATANQQPRTLSGGMKQRASIARALLKSPSILLCDEPTSALDADSGQVVMGILKRIAIEEQRVVMVVSHDSRVFPYADRLIKLENGRVVSDTRERYVEGRLSAP
jgi:putative ABC transport system ATP-binding protein